MPSREAYPLNAEAYRKMLLTLENDTELRERMPTSCRLVIYTMLLCGLRIGEAVTMCAPWVKTSGGGKAIRVPGEVDGNGFTPKTQAGSRTVPVPSSFTCHATGEEIEVEFEKELAAFFVNNHKFRKGESAVRRWLHETAIAAGVEESRQIVERTHGKAVLETPDVIAHDCRASWCAQCLRSDCNRYTVRDWGGWADMTMINRYASYVGDPSGEQIDRF
jgi:integrase